MSSSFNFCRLCLQKFTGASHILNQDFKTYNMVKHVLSEMDINLVKTSKICPECLKYVQFSYTMKETIMKNEEKIKSNTTAVQNVEENICRLCLSLNDLQTSIFLYEKPNLAITFLEARSIIEIAIEEMHFEIFKKPVVCNSCWKIVRSIYLFKKRCFVIEKILKFYCTKNNFIYLMNSEIESISNCYNSNLLKYSKDINDLGTILRLGQNIDTAPQVVTKFVKNIITPLDVYLNNFTNDDEDDIFEEESDDLFEEKTHPLKAELAADIKVERENEEVKSTDMEEIVNAVSNVSTEQIEILSQYYTCTDTLQNHLEKSQEKNIVGTESNDVFDESLIYVEDTLITETKSRKSSTEIRMTDIESSLKASIPSRIGDINCLNMSLIATDNVANVTMEANNITENIKLDQKEKVVNNNDLIKGKVIHTIGNCKEILEIERESPKCNKTHKKTKNHHKLEKKIYKKRKKDAKGSINQGILNKAQNTVQNNIGKMFGLSGKKLTIKLKRVQDSELSKLLETHHKEIGKNDNIENCKQILKPTLKNLNNIKENKIWLCDQCEFKTKYKQHLFRHKLIHYKDGEILTCPKCVDYSTNIQRNLDRHMLKHFSENFFRCAHCLYSTINKAHLMGHMRTHERSHKGNQVDQKTQSKSMELTMSLGFKCEECPFITSKEPQIVSHLRTHKSKEKIMKCGECYYITTKIHSFKNHMELHNKSLSEKKFKCKLCSFRGKRYTHLVSHMLTHQEEYKFSCSHCSYKAKRKSHLKTHMLRHQSGDKKVMFQCPYCKYKSVRKDHLKVHCQNVHYDKKQVNCKEAKVIAENEKNNTNQDKKILQCPYCSYSNLNGVLAVHINIVHFPSNSTEMECADCSFKTDIKTLFVKHVRSHRREV